MPEILAETVPNSTVGTRKQLFSFQNQLDQLKKRGRISSMPKSKYVVTVYLLLVLTTLAAYWQIGNHGFIDWDDIVYITENGHIRNGITLEGLRWAFTTNCAANWHPLTWVSHMLDVQFFGLNPGWHHITSLLFHIANVLLLFFVLHRMTKAFWQSAFVAVLFALHPLHVESVAWAAERKDVLAALFWMLTLAAYGCYAENPRLKSYLAVMLFLALGLMAKPMLVTLPFVLLLLDYWPLERFRDGKAARRYRAESISTVPVRKKKGKTGKQAPKTVIEIENPANGGFRWALVRPLLLEKIPLLVLTILSCVATYIAQSSVGAVASVQALTPDMRLANAFVSYIVYIAKTIWPDNLAVFYPHPGSWPVWEVSGAVLILAVVTFAVIRTRKIFPFLPVGWLWFTGTLVPVIGIVQVGSQAMADRYTYIPSIGLFIMAAWGIPEALKKLRYKKQVLVASSAVCLACIFALTWIQAGYWRDSITLYDHALSITKNNYSIHNNRGLVLEHLGYHVEAMADFDRAIEIYPRFSEAYTNRGIVYKSLGNFARAVEDFTRAIEFDPKNAEAYTNRGSAHMVLGNRAQALEDYSSAIAVEPQYTPAYFNRGIFYQYSQMYPQAVEDYDKAISINPGYAKAYFNRGMIYNALGRESEAIKDIKTAARLGSEKAGGFLQSRGLNW
jgi:protein O-mannosyl-transferase